jgi:predicted small metal-binding protein
VINADNMPSFKCKDIGMACPFEASAKTEDELMKQIGEHAAKVHDMKTVPADMMVKIKKAIKK